MNISQKNKDNLSATLTVTIEKNDYEQRVKKALNDYRRKAEVRGFRPGMAPMSIIEKTYGKTVLMDELNKLISDGLSKYIEDAQLKMFGEPIPSDTEHTTQDLDNQESFEFVFDIGLLPTLTFTLSKDDTVPYYTITITEAEKEVEKQAILKECGQLVEVETANENAILKVDLTQGDRIIEDTLISLKVIANVAMKEPFIGKKAGDELTVDIKQTFTNKTDLAVLLKVDKNELPQIAPLFTIKIKKIEQQVDAELNQELYDRLFGKDVVTEEAVFMQKIEERLQNKYMEDSEQRFSVDAYRLLEKKAAITLPDDFLKRWLKYTNKDKLTTEDIEEGYHWLAEEYHRQVLHAYILQKENIEITQDDMLEYATRLVTFQFSMYGVFNAPEESLIYYVNRLLANEKERKRINNFIERDKIVAYVKTAVTLDERSITSEALQALYEQEEQQKQQAHDRPKAE
ncbi:MAG: trigger factor family protein [Prevotellaceae bacterium]|jgi:trigger factor|nr:trigger factor family protein [Prevotellaceae bacterium]